jgi:hypothetical protein
MPLGLSLLQLTPQLDWLSIFQVVQIGFIVQEVERSSVPS